MKNTRTCSYILNYCKFLFINIDQELDDYENEAIIDFMRNCEIKHIRTEEKCKKR